MPYIVLLFFVYGFHISVVGMVGCFIVAIVVFLMCAVFFRFSYERKKGVNAIEDKEQLIFYLLIALLSIFIDVLVYYCDNLKCF
ncbi:unknown [Clostridium sp. CAG:411]|nr:unknown [Clostridium sp. CAG:411]